MRLHLLLREALERNHLLFDMSLRQGLAVNASNEVLEDSAQRDHRRRLCQRSEYFLKLPQSVAYVPKPTVDFFGVACHAAALGHCLVIRSERHFHFQLRKRLPSLWFLRARTGLL